jgi:hypothetical protein
MARDVEQTERTIGLLAGEIGMASERALDVGSRNDRSLPRRSPCEESRLDLDQLGCAEHGDATGADAAVVEADEDLGIAAGGRSGEEHDALGGEEPVSQALDLGRRRRGAGRRRRYAGQRLGG